LFPAGKGLVRVTAIESTLLVAYVHPEKFQGQDANCPEVYVKDLKGLKNILDYSWLEIENIPCVLIAELGFTTFLTIMLTLECRAVELLILRTEEFIKIAFNKDPETSAVVFEVKVTAFGKLRNKGFLGTLLLLSKLIVHV